MSANGLHQIQWRRVVLTRVHRTRRVSVCETLRKYYGNVEHVEGFARQESIRRATCKFETSRLKVRRNVT